MYAQIDTRQGDEGQVKAFPSSALGVTLRVLERQDHIGLSQEDNLVEHFELLHFEFLEGLHADQIHQREDRKHHHDKDYERVDGHKDDDDDE